MSNKNKKNHFSILKSELKNIAYINSIGEKRYICASCGSYVYKGEDECKHCGYKRR